MTYPSEPLTVIGQPLCIPIDRCDASPPSGRCDASLPAGRCDASLPAGRCDASLPAGRSRVKLILLGDADAVDQSVIELERRGYCDSYAWTPPLLIRENAPPIQPLPGELMRFYQRWYPLTGQRIPL